MQPDEFRELIRGGDLSVPFVIKTKGGRSYTIHHRGDAYISDSNPNMAYLSLRERGVLVLRLASIEAIHHEPEPVAS